MTGWQLLSMYGFLNGALRAEGAHVCLAAMPMKKFRMTNTELKLKRQRMMAAYNAGMKAWHRSTRPVDASLSSACASTASGRSCTDIRLAVRVRFLLPGSWVRSLSWCGEILPTGGQ